MRGELAEDVTDPGTLGHYTRRAVPRVAFLPDSFLEINGVARTSAALDRFARKRSLPFLTVHAGPALKDEWTPRDGGRLQLPRSALSFHLEADLACDLLIWRHAGRVRRALAAFRPDVLHVTGPNDMGQLGAWLAWRLRIPLVASWHTNVHEFAARRASRYLSGLPADARHAMPAWIERRVLDAAALFYKTPRALLAPNRELVEMLERRTGKRTWLMRRGIDTDLFSPARRDAAAAGPFRIGYVGRLSPEKNVRMLAEIERALAARVAERFEVLVVGDGAERGWLQREMRSARFTGVLHGEELARACASMDVFAFPSVTDTFGNVVLEALASGTPAIVTPYGGPRTIIEENVTGLVAETPEGFADAIATLMADPARHRAMRDAARAHALRFSWDEVFETVYEAYGFAVGRTVE